MSEQKSMKKSGQMISVAPASLKSRNLCGKERHKVITQQMLVITANIGQLCDTDLSHDTTCATFFVDVYTGYGGWLLHI